MRGINRLIPWWSGPPGSRIDESTIVGLYQNILKKKKKVSSLLLCTLVKIGQFLLTEQIESEVSQVLQRMSCSFDTSVVSPVGTIYAGVMTLPCPQTALHPASHDIYAHPQALPRPVWFDLDCPLETAGGLLKA